MESDQLHVPAIYLYISAMGRGSTQKPPCRFDFPLLHPFFQQEQSLDSSCLFYFNRNNCSTVHAYFISTGAIARLPCNFPSTGTIDRQFLFTPSIEDSRTVVTIWTNYSYFIYVKSFVRTEPTALRMRTCISCKYPRLH